MDYYKLYLEDLSFLNIIPPQITVKMYVTLNFFEYCISTCEMFKNVISYNNSIRVRSCHDVVPSMLKCRIFTKGLIRNGFLNDIYDEDIFKQTIEINNLIFNKYIILKKVEKSKAYYFISKIKPVCSIGLHIRYDDICINNNRCNISKSIIDGYVNIINDIDPTKQCNIYIASSNIYIIKSLKNIVGSRVIEYLHRISPSHSGIESDLKKDNNKNDKIRKIIGDIYFLSNSDRFILSSLSTFSLLIYYIGSKFLNGTIKPVIIVDSTKGEIDKLQIYDHISYYGHKKIICKHSPFSKYLVYPYHLLKYKINDI